MQFILFTKEGEKTKTGKIVKDALAQHLEKSDCSQCKSADVCLIKNNPEMIGVWLHSQSDNYVSIKDAIKLCFDQSDFIILIDSLSGICYVYKGAGDFALLKKTVIKHVLNLYSKMYKTSILMEVQDLRAIPLDIKYQAN